MQGLEDELRQVKGYTYSLWDYRRSHIVLTLRGIDENKPSHNVHLTFANVLYLQMPIRWTGDLSIAEENEFIEVLNRANINILPPNGLEALKSVYTLYRAENPKTLVYIMGKLNSIEYDVEPIYN